MIKVTLDVMGSASIVGFRASGHSGYAESGSDIVCAAASALLQTAAYGLREVAGLSIGIDLDEENADLTVVLERDLSQSDRQKADMILKTMRLGLEALEQQYPKNIIIAERRCN